MSLRGGDCKIDNSDFYGDWGFLRKRVCRYVCVCVCVCFVCVCAGVCSCVCMYCMCVCARQSGVGLYLCCGDPKGRETREPAHLTVARGDSIPS